MSLFTAIGKAIGIGSSPKPAPPITVPVPIVTTKPTPAAATVKQELTAMVASLPDDVGPSALLYVQGGKLTLSAHSASGPYLVQMLAEGTKYVGASMVPAPVQPATPVKQ